MANDNTLPVVAHILGLFTGFLGPLILLFVVEQDPKAQKHVRMALNWQLSLLIYAIVSMILVLVLIGLLLLPVLMVINIIFCIIAAVKASQGELWNYPITIPFLRV